MTDDGKEERSIGLGQSQRLCVGRYEDDRNKVSELNEHARSADDKKCAVSEQRNVEHY